MSDDEEVFFWPVGKVSQNVQAMFCYEGFGRFLEQVAGLQRRKARKVSKVPNKVYLREYIQIRYRDESAGRDVRTELGKWLLNSGLVPVAHLNGHPLDFRLVNLEARETERQVNRHTIASAKRRKHEEQAARRNVKRKPISERKRDGLTPEQQEAKLCSPDFQNVLLRIAGRYVKDQMQRGRPDNPTDEMRAPEIVAEATADIIPRVRRDEILDVGAYACRVVCTKAHVELGRILDNLGHVAKPKTSLV